MNHYFKTIAISFILTFTSMGIMTSAHADDQSSGCGLGWQLFKKNSLVSSFSREITNALASNTIAMTSGTAVGANHDLVLKNKAALYYAEANYQKLQSELAEGKGEHLRTFAKVLGCQGNSIDQVGVVFQRNYETIFPTDQILPSEMLDHVTDSLSRSEFSALCSTGV